MTVRGDAITNFGHVLLDDTVVGHRVRQSRARVWHAKGPACSLALLCFIRRSEEFWQDGNFVFLDGSSGLVVAAFRATIQLYLSLRA